MQLSDTRHEILGHSLTAMLYIWSIVAMNPSESFRIINDDELDIYCNYIALVIQKSTK